VPLYVTDGLKFYIKAFLDQYGKWIRFESSGLRGRPRSPRLVPDNSLRYAQIIHTFSNTVSDIDTATNTVTATVAVGLGPLVFGQFIGPATGTQPPGATPSGASQKTNNQIKIGNQDQYAATYGSGSVASNIVIAPRIGADSTCIITVVGNSDEVGNKVRAKVTGAKIESHTAENVGPFTGKLPRVFEKESTYVQGCRENCNSACGGRESCDVEACIDYCKEDKNCYEPSHGDADRNDRIDR
jgi:YVTN family beta-propeller protein